MSTFPLLLSNFFVFNVVDGSVDAADLDTDSVGSDEIAADAVDSSPKLEPNNYGSKRIDVVPNSHE